MGVILAFIIGAAAIVSVLFFVSAVNKKQSSTVKGVSGLVAFALVMIFIFIPFGFKTVNTGELAVVKVFGEAKETKSAGLFWVLPLTTTVEMYDLRTQQIAKEIAAYSLDAQTMSASLYVQFRIQSDKVIDINREFGGIDILTDRVSSVAEEKTKVVLSKDSAMDIIKNRSDLSQRVENEIKANMAQYYVDITMVVVSNIDFNDAFEKAVEDKMIAEQAKLQAQFDKDKAVIKAEEELEVAKLQAEAAIETAKGSALSQIEIAKAQAEVIQLKSVEIARMLGFEVSEDNQIITDGHSPEEIKLISDYLKYIEYLNAWDGKLPTVITGEGAEILIPMP